MPFRENLRAALTNDPTGKTKVRDYWLGLFDEKAKWDLDEEKWVKYSTEDYTKYEVGQEYTGHGQGKGWYITRIRPTGASGGKRTGVLHLSRPTGDTPIGETHTILCSHELKYLPLKYLLRWTRP
jgi:hypothetical protein